MPCSMRSHSKSQHNVIAKLAKEELLVQLGADRSIAIPIIILHALIFVSLRYSSLVLNIPSPGAIMINILV